MASAIFNLSLFCLAFSPTLALPQSDTSSTDGTCNSPCYSALANYNSQSPYSGNGICYNWFSGYPPAWSTSTISATEYLATIYFTTFSTRTERVWTLPVSETSVASDSPTSTPSSAPSSAPAAATSTSPTPTSTLITSTSVAQTSSPDPTPTPTPAPTTTTTSTTLNGLPLPNSDLVTSCSNSPESLYSACSCIGDVYKTFYMYTTSTISSTTTQPTITRECTVTLTSTACQADATYGLQPSAIRFGDTGIPGSAQPVAYSSNNGTGMSAAACCAACFNSPQNCRYFTYTPPTSDPNSTDALPDGGSCALDLEGDTCPWHTFPTSYYGPVYNYINEGMYQDPSQGGASANGAYWAFGPCADEVPRFYGYQAGRAGVGNCFADTATSTAYAP